MFFSGNKNRCRPTSFTDDDFLFIVWRYRCRPTSVTSNNEERVITVADNFRTKFLSRVISVWTNNSKQVHLIHHVCVTSRPLDIKGCICHFTRFDIQRDDLIMRNRDNAIMIFFCSTALLLMLRQRFVFVRVKLNMLSRYELSVLQQLDCVIVLCIN